MLGVRKHGLGAQQEDGNLALLQCSPGFRPVLCLVEDESQLFRADFQPLNIVLTQLTKIPCQFHRLVGMSGHVSGNHSQRGNAAAVFRQGTVSVAVVGIVRLEIQGHILGRAHSVRLLGLSLRLRSFLVSFRFHRLFRLFGFFRNRFFGHGLFRC